MLEITKQSSLSVVSSGLAILLSSIQVSAAEKIEIECALTNKCVESVCSAIDPQPLFLRFLSLEGQPVVMTYGSPKLLGGPEPKGEGSPFFRWNIPDGVISLSTEGDFSNSSSQVWVNLHTPNGMRQRLLIGQNATRQADGKKVTAAQLLPGSPETQKEQIQDGFEGECRWHVDVAWVDELKLDGLADG